MRNASLLSALIYTGASVAVCAVFLIATLGRDYTALERSGGAIWVFILSMIILMPLVTPAVKKRLGK